MKIDKLEVEVEYTMNEPTFPESIMDQYKQAMREVLEERNRIQTALNEAVKALKEMAIKANSDYELESEILSKAAISKIEEILR